jgi:hypothetical protein
MVEELQIGSFGMSVVLSILLRLIYGTWEVDNRYKPWIAVLSGMALAFTAMYFSGIPCVGKTVLAYTTQGFMTGASATGIYEMTKRPETVLKP